MNLETIITNIKELKAKVYSKDTKENYSEYYELCKKVLHGDRSIISSPYYTNTLNLQRGRKNNGEKIFYNLGDLWYPPIEYASKQRFNLKGLPMFYAGNDLSTALIELKPNDGEIITIIEIGLDVPELKCIQLVEEKLGDADKNMVDFKRAAWQFIMEEAKKPVEDKRPQDYYATQIFAQSLRDTAYQHFDAIAYNSVATTLKGYNFVIKPEFIDKHYIFKKATVFKIYDFVNREDFKIRCLFSCDKISSYGRLEYKPVLLCSGHHISLNNYIHEKA